MNYLNYIAHQLFVPPALQRRYELDLPEQPMDTRADRLQRIVTAVLPFVALYRPVGVVLNVGMGGCRVLTHLNGGIQAEQLGNWSAMSGHLLFGLLAVCSVAGSVFHVAVGSYLSTSSEMCQGVWRLIEQGMLGHYAIAFEEVLHLVASGLYLGFLTTGTLEIILLSTLIQGVICLYQARRDIAQGRYIEAGAKCVLAGVRGYQLHHYAAQIKRRNQLIELKKYQDLFERVLRAKRVRHLIEHPLVQTQEQIDAHRIILSDTDNEYEFGSHFHGYGQDLVKGNNLCIRNVSVDGQERIELEFKLNHVAREQLEHTLKNMRRLNPKELREVLSLSGSQATSVSVGDQGSLIGFIGEGQPSPEWKITAEGLGSIALGQQRCFLDADSTALPNLYDRVVIQMTPDKTLYDLHELMALVDLDRALCPSTSEQIDRLKLGHLFRVFFPQEAFILERDPLFFEEPIDKLRERMYSLAPKMQQVEASYWDQMAEGEIVPGRVRYQLRGLADEVRGEGMACLTTAITGPQEDEELFSRVASVLSMGMISTEWRDRYGVNTTGLARGGDYLAGGADSIYLQMVPSEFIKKGRGFEELTWYHSRVRLNLSLKVLESGTYQYLSCAAGNRLGSHTECDECEEFYAQRLGILEFAKTLNEAMHKGVWNFFRSHEVMAKERVDPTFIEGLWVKDTETKMGLIAYLTSKGLVDSSPGQGPQIRGVPIDRFIQVRS